jgi:hypothetical protein
VPENIPNLSIRQINCEAQADIASSTIETTRQSMHVPMRASCCGFKQ